MIEIDVSKVFKRLSHIETGLTNYTPLNILLAQTLLNETKLNFMNEGRPAWAALSERTLARRGSASAKLRVSDTLYNSIQAFHSSDEAGVGTNVVHGPTHQYGDPERNIPARPYFPITSDGKLTPEAEVSLGDVMHLYLTRLAGGK